MPKPKQTLLEPDMVSDNFPSRQFSYLRFLPWVIVILVIMVAAALGFMQHRRNVELNKIVKELKQNPQKATEEESKALLDKISQLIELPSEQPTIATVTDLAPLKDQPFFAHAQVGDKVLIFSQAKKAVLYRPSTNKVIEVAPVNLDNEPSKINTNTNTNTKAQTNANANSNSVNKNSNTSNLNSNN